MKILNITHKSCMDGSIAHAVVRAKYGNSVHLYEHQYHAQIPLHAMKGYDLILMTDISFPDIEDYKYLAENNKRVVSIDHHPTMKKNILDRLNGEDIGVEFIFSTKKSGAGLTLEWLKGSHSKDFKELVRHVSNRDLWDFSDIETKPIYMALVERARQLNKTRSPIIQATSVAMIAEDIDNGKLTLGELRSEGLRLVSKMNDDIKEYVSKNVEYSKVSYHGTKTLALAGEYTPHISETASYVLDEGLADIYVAYFNPRDNKESIVFSIRTRDGTALKIAESNKGGGHPDAAGCNFYFDPFKIWDKDFIAQSLVDATLLESYEVSQDLINT